MDKIQKFSLVKTLSKLEDDCTPHEYRGVNEVIELIKKEESLTSVLKLAEERENEWNAVHQEFQEYAALESANGVILAIITLKDSMVVDLNTCEAGDKLISCHGNVLYYVRRTTGYEYLDHVVEYAEKNRGNGSRTNDGYTFLKNRQKTDENIVQIIKN